MPPWNHCQLPRNTQFQRVQCFKIHMIDYKLIKDHIHKILADYLCTGCPKSRAKSLGQFLKPHISKTTIHDGKFETYLERENLGDYFVTKLDIICNTSVGRYTLNDSAATDTLPNIIYISGAQVYKAIIRLL